MIILDFHLQNGHAGTFHLTSTDSLFPFAAVESTIFGPLNVHARPNGKMLR